MKVQVDADVCAGHGVCTGLAPDLFDLTDAGYSVARTADVPPEHEAAVRAAANQCPTGAIAITITEGSTGSDV